VNHTAAAAFPLVEETEVLAQAKRRTFTAEFKRRILKELAACRKPGEIGALLRREGLYSSHLVAWRRARDRGELATTSTKKRGPEARKPDPRDKQIVELNRELRKTKARAERFEKMLEIQKKVAALMDERFPPESTEKD
jgi:transposase-like protein